MLTSAECRQRAEQKIAEADLHPRQERRLRSAAEGWLVLAGIKAVASQGDSVRSGLPSSCITNIRARRTHWAILAK
jgi:hypothetical protein